MANLRTACMGGVAAAAILGAPAMARQSVDPAPARPQAETTAELPELVVTARRREERAQTVPVAISVFTPEILKARNITNQVDLANSTPSMVANASGFPRQFGGFAIRGQGPAFGATAGTVAYFAEVPNGYVPTEGRPGTFFDLASVQILKGPQGTLFGKNATGGNILFEPHRPTNALEGYGQVQIGNYNDREFEGALNLPLVDDKLMLRVSAASARRDGYTKDVGPIFAGKDYDNLAYDNVRVGLLFRPTDAFENYTVLRHYQSKDHGGGTTLFDFNPAAAGSVPGFPPFPVLAFFPNLMNDLADQRARGPRKVSYGLDQYYKFKMDQVINSTTFEISPTLSIKNTASYSRTYYSYGYDYDATPYPIAGQASPSLPLGDEDYFTEELQLQGRAFNDGLQYVVGGFIDSQWPHATSQGRFDAFPLSTLLGGRVEGDQRLATRSRAAFAQATYDMAKLSPTLEGLSVTAGYRYTVDHASSSTMILAPPATSGSADFNYGSYTFNVDYKITPRIMVYAGARSAYKAGGVNTQIPSSSPYAAFKPERLRDVEVGLKSDMDLGGAKLRANLDVFSGDYLNIQRTTQAIGPGGVLVNVTRSAAEARIRGLEFEGALIPSRHIELTLAYSYTDSKYTKVTDALAGAVLNGAAFPYTPKNKLSVGAKVYLPVDAALGQVSLSAAYSLQSKQSIAQTNDSVYPYIPGYDVVNLRADWRNVAGRPVTISAFVTNVADKTYAVGQFDAFNTTGFVTRTYAEPRMYGLQVRYDFGG